MTLPISNLILTCHVIGAKELKNETFQIPFADYSLGTHPVLPEETHTEDLEAEGSLEACVTRN